MDAGTEAAIFDLFSKLNYNRIDIDNVLDNSETYIRVYRSDMENLITLIRKMVDEKK